MINPRAIALQGLGYGAAVMAAMGLAVIIAVEVPQPVTPSGPYANYSTYGFTKPDLQRHIKAVFKLPSEKVQVLLNDPRVLASSSFTPAEAEIKTTSGVFKASAGSRFQLISVTSAAAASVWEAKGQNDLSDEELILLFLATIDD